MLFVIQIAVVSVLLAFGAAASAAQNRSTFSIHQTANPGHVRNGPAAYVKALVKFGAAPEKISAALDAVPGSVRATPRLHDAEWLCPVTIGDQIFTLNFDTASSDFWVFGAEAHVTDHMYYIPGSTAERIRDAGWYISYGDGSNARGIVYKDTVDVGGVSVTGQAIGVATYAQASPSYARSVSDGFLGLGFGDFSSIRPRQKTWFDSARSQGLPAVFAADLGVNSPGYYDFGALNGAYSESHITYTDVDDERGYWKFSPDSYSVGSGPSNPIGAGVIDTSTSILLLEDSVVRAYYSQVESAQYEPTQEGWLFECDSILPDFTLTIDGYDAVIPGSYLNYAAADQVGVSCYGGIQSKGGMRHIVYGAIFIKSQYVVFDQRRGWPRVGFTAKVERE